MKRTFRNPTYPLGGFLLILVIVVVAIADAHYIARFPHSESINRLVAYVAGVVLAVFGAIRPVVEADSEGLVVKNPFRTYRFPWPEVKGFRAEDRVVVVLHDGREIRCWSVQRANAARMLGKRSIVDDVADELESIRVNGLPDPPES